MIARYLMTAAKNGMILLMDENFEVLDIKSGERPRGIEIHDNIIAVACSTYFQCFIVRDNRLIKLEVKEIGLNNHDIFYEDNEFKILSIPGAIIHDNYQLGLLIKNNVIRDAAFITNTYTSENLWTGLTKDPKTPDLVYINGEFDTSQFWSKPHHIIEHSNKNHYVCNSRDREIVCIETKVKTQTPGFSRSLRELDDGNMIFVSSKMRKYEDENGNLIELEDSCVCRYNTISDTVTILKSFPKYPYIYDCLPI